MSFWENYLMITDMLSMSVLNIIIKKGVDFESVVFVLLWYHCWLTCSPGTHPCHVINRDQSSPFLEHFLYKITTQQFESPIYCTQMFYIHLVGYLNMMHWFDAVSICGTVFNPSQWSLEIIFIWACKFFVRATLLWHP